MYEVIHYFTDLQDNEYPYNVGDIFPRNGFSVTEERLQELAGTNNKQHKPLIKKIKEEKKEQSLSELPKITKTEINRMSTSELQLLATKVGIKNPSGINKNELKKHLINIFEL